ncbi:CCR4-NOT transcription complex subunit 3 isoform X2 [Aplysia californica]|uniref:CCR4-NOT transcription complex subunit 3 isoform X2 n=1 Tax=Aplysia californica TaxID=6500 RepID=A0ABM1A0A0_APLCA|nr:CCR4-NOT transcription complex subunit 3 isoform X2 [Aplysia californica]
MADRRKLQAEIERCLKKVDEGVETFEDIWKKVQTATNSNQKEKFETDLKKEIKKLQRLRDQIKSWIANSDIKDKTSLLDHRKLIEMQMERFKVVERETKTKAYSKDGLGAAAKLDPQMKEKADTTQWLSSVIDNLQLQLDQFESELESRSGSNKKKGKDPKCEELKQHQERHKYHIEMLEQIMRRVDNDKVAVDKIKELRDDIEYYVESCQDPSFQENLYMYDDLDLGDIGISETTALASSPPEGEDFLDKIGSTPSSTNSSSPSPSPSVNANHSSEKHEEIDRKRHKSQSEEKKGASPAPSGTSNNKTQSSLGRQHSQNNSQAQNSDSNSVNSNHHSSTTVSPLTAYAAAAGGQHNSSSDSSRPHVNSIDHAASGSLSSSVGLSSTTNTNSVSLTSSGNPSVPSEPSPQTLAVAATPALSSVNSSASSGITSSQVLNSRTDVPPVMNGPLSAGGPSKNDQMSLRTMAQQVIANAELEKIMPSSHAPVDSLTSPDALTGMSCHSSRLSFMAKQCSCVQKGLSVDLKDAYNNSSPAPSSQTPTVPSSSEPCSVTLTDAQLASQLPQQQMPQAPQTNTIHLNPLLGMAPLGPIQLTKDQHYQLSNLEAAYHHLPHPSDSERMRHFLPRNPCPTPTYYPSATFPHADTVELYQRCSTETLFFIFYYMEGTKAQYLAAKALKKQSWRFHTKYMMWFQRHEEPKQITEEYEQGTYIYFDYEKWGQKKKEGFTFEYRYLEDRDLN